MMRQLDVERESTLLHQPDKNLETQVFATKRDSSTHGAASPCLLRTLSTAEVVDKKVEPKGGVLPRRDLRLDKADNSKCLHEDLDIMEDFEIPYLMNHLTIPGTEPSMLLQAINEDYLF